MSGLAVVAGGPGLKRFEVTQVWPHTAGAEAKVRKGDIIEAINDEAAADMSLPEIRALFRQPGARYRVLLQRDNQTLTVNMQMKRLLELAH
jgi:C-terminal processing protease CtpA/Prc